MSILLRYSFVFFCISSYVFAAETAPIPIHPVKHLFDIGGPKKTLLSLPSDVAVDKHRIYVVDSGHHRVVVFDKDGDQELIIGKEGIRNGQFRGPVGIDVDSQGRIYVADKGNHRIQVFDKKGKHLVSIVTADKNKSLVSPVDVTVDESSELIYVTGNNNHKLMIYNFPGYVLEEWGGDGVDEGFFRYPGTLTLLHDKRIAVVDILNTRVQVFTTKGKLSLQVGEWGVLPGQLFRPKGIAIDKQGRFYISDSYMNLVQVFTDGGRFQAVLGKRDKPSSFKTAAGIAIDDDMKLYVAEMLEHKVSVHSISEYK
ncbi:MAG: NHL repeat-containing protein [Gammaproteobacteria bacterium]|nr:NHL repeat-containing protein [Gammaproteobacteria bacterium]